MEESQSIFRCSCTTITFSGILCRHSISVIMAHKIDFAELTLNPRWLKIDNDVKSEESNEKVLVIAKVLKSNENTNQPPN